MIFSPVIAISLLMIAFLPNLSQPADVYREQASPPAAAQALEAPALDLLPAGAEPAEQKAPPSLPAAKEPASALPVQDEPAENPPPAAPARLPAGEADGQLAQFAASLAGSPPSQLAGVYVEGLFALRVVEQPPNDENFVSSDGDVLTRFRTPSQHGVTAILAHNYLSGRLFFQIRPGQEIVLVYGGGLVERYRVASIQNYQALSPHDVRSDFRDLNGPGGQVISAGELFNRVYTRAGTLVLQTCIEANGEPSWGRVFIIAEPEE